MDDKNLNKEFLDGHELPINIPSSDYAWNNMQKRLNEEDHGRLGGPIEPTFVIKRFALVIVLLILSITLWLLTNNKQVTNRSNNKAKKTSSADDNLSSNAPVE